MTALSKHALELLDTFAKGCDFIFWIVAGGGCRQLGSLPASWDSRIFATFVVYALGYALVARQTRIALELLLSAARARRGETMDVGDL